MKERERKWQLEIEAVQRCSEVQCLLTQRDALVRGLPWTKHEDGLTDGKCTQG